MKAKKIIATTALSAIVLGLGITSVSGYDDSNTGPEPRQDRSEMQEYFANLDEYTQEELKELMDAHRVSTDELYTELRDAEET